VLVKATVVQNRGRSGWYLHGVYLQREGAQTQGRGLGFDSERDDISISKTLARWQRAGDRHMFKLIISPEHGSQIDMPQFGRDLVAVIEQDLATKTEWVGIDHYNNGHPHVHLLIRGRDAQGRELQIDADYLWDGIRQRAREVATRTLGWRTAQEIAQSREQAVTRETWTELDEMLRRRMDPERTIALTDGPEQLTPHEFARLEVLVQRGLAWKAGEHAWEMSRAWEQRLQEQGEAPIQRQDRGLHREQERQHAHEHEREHERGGEDDQQRRLAQILDIEHELEWDR
jgi:type IV secretory pathway VirD2 relaxase